MRVFVSSTLQELAAERAAAESAITRLRLTPTMFELGARHHPPRDLYRAYLAQSEVFVGIYGRQYGWVAPGEEVSGLEDEYLLAAGMPKLIYVKAAAEREPRLVRLLDPVSADDQASYKRFEDTEDLAELLADDLAVLLTERFAQSGPSTPRGLRAATPPTPQTAIVGREGEIATVVALLREPDVHLVTLIGPGGIGKTRLALEVARRFGAAAALDAVSFVDLASVHDAAVWPDVVAAALGIRPEGTRPVVHLLIDRLQGQRLLLILDNFEQLVSAADQLGELLAACPELTVLVTSRIVLHLRGEREVALAPLATPAGDGQTDVESIGQSAAVQLLVTRAQQVRSSFALTATNAAAVAELSRRLDGIPLALELAGAQLRLLPRRRCCAASAIRWTWLRAPSMRPIGSGRCGPRSSGDTACSGRGSAVCSRGSRCSPARGRSRRQRPSEPWTGIWTRLTRCPPWSRRAWSAPTRPIRAACGSGCWTRSAPTRASDSRNAGRPTPPSAGSRRI